MFFQFKFVFLIVCSCSILNVNCQTENEQKNGSNVSSPLVPIPNMLVLPLQQKVDMKIHEAVDMINQIIHSTNDSIIEYFDNKYRQAQEAYAKLIADVDQEKLGASFLLEKMIANSKETVVNLQQYFAEVMDTTMEKTYTDIKTILNNAVSKIDTVSRNIKDNLKSNHNELRINEKIESHKSLAKLINTGIESIKKLAFKFKHEPLSSNEPINPKWMPILQPRAREMDKNLYLRRTGSNQRLEASLRKEQEFEAMQQERALNEAEKKMAAVASKLAATRRVKIEADSNNTDASPSNEKIVMTKTGGFLERLMNLWNPRA